MPNNSHPTEAVFLSYDGMTDPLGESQVLPYLKGLVERGVSMRLVSFEKPDRMTKDGARIQAFCTTQSIEWHPLVYHKSPPVLSTLYDGWKLKQKLRALYRDKPFHILHCRSYITAEEGLRWKKSHGTGFLFDMRGFFPDERVDGGVWNLKNPLYKAIYTHFKRREKELLLAADRVISLTHKGKEIMEAFPYLTNKSNWTCSVIPCCTDLAHFDPEAVSREKAEMWRKELRLVKAGTVIIYVGSLGTWYLVDEMVAFFAQWLKQEPDAVWLVATRDDASGLWKRAKELGIPSDSIRVQGFSRQDLPSVISLADFALFFIKAAYSKQASSPTKQGELMAMNVPVICNRGVGDSDYIVEHFKSGILVDQLSDESYAKAIDQALALLGTQMHHLRAGAEAYFALTRGVEAYFAAYQEVLQKVESRRA